MERVCQVFNPGSPQAQEVLTIQKLTVTSAQESARKSLGSSVGVAGFTGIASCV
jgi:hypothetical protein